jgi:hypothetical protein
MESVIRNVNEIASEERRMYESVLGHAHEENQRVVIQVLELELEPDGKTRQAAMTRAARIARRGRAAAEAQGITPREADVTVEQSIAEVRRAQR